MNTSLLYRSTSRKGSMRREASVPRAVASLGGRGYEFLARGFTAIELLVVVAIVAIMAAVAMPSYIAMGNKTRARALASGLIRDIQLARATAIQTGQPVYICPSAGTGQCASSSSSWLAGWIVYENPNGTSTSLGATSQVVSSAQPDTNSTDTATWSSTTTTLTFNHQGFAPAAGSGVTFTFQAGTGNSNKFCVVVTAIGAATQYSGGQTTSLGTAC